MEARTWFTSKQRVEDLAEVVLLERVDDELDAVVRGFLPSAVFVP